MLFGDCQAVSHSLLALPGQKDTFGGGVEGGGGKGDGDHLSLSEELYLPPDGKKTHAAPR